MKAMGKRSVSSFLAGLLAVCWYVAIVLLALGVCLLAVSPFVEPPRIEVGLSLPASFSLDARMSRVSAPSLGVDDAHLEKVTGSVTFSPRSKIVVAWSAIGIILWLLFVLWVLAQLRGLFRALREGAPFVPANATRLRRIGWAVIVGELVRSVFVFYANYYVMTRFSAEGLQFSAWPGVEISDIVSGLIILVIAEVFAAGARLDEEQSLTV
jgi:Protein of unknown function (DUF2975)